MPSSGKYYAQARVQGKLVRQSLKTTDRMLAKRRLVEFLEKVRRLKPGSGKQTFGDLVIQWKATVLASKPMKQSSKNDRTWSIDALLKHWHGLETLPIKDVDEDGCRTWMAKRSQMISPSRVNHELSSLKMLLEYACKHGLILSNPAANLEKLKKIKRKPIIPSKDQFNKLVQDLRKRGNPDAADFVEVLGYSGMRRNEAAYLNWPDIDFERDQFTIRGNQDGTKNLEERTIPLFPALKKLFLQLKERPNINPSGRVLTLLECRGSIDGACKRLSLPKYSHHDFRHFFCSNAVEAGIDFKVIADWLGHKDGGLLVARTYSHLRAEHSRLMAQKMTFEVNS